MSAPLKRSFNDAVIEDELPKITMASVKQVSEAIYSHGKGCFLSKLDMVSAYKLIPTRPDQWRLQGFCWLHKYFIELRQTFGAKPSVVNYDIFHHVFCLIIRLMTESSQKDLLRALDDLIVITNTITANYKFVSKYIKLAEDLNIPLAPIGQHDKAFIYQTKGTILGTHFNTVDMKWSLSHQKVQTYMYQLSQVIKAPTVSLKTLESINGVLNTIVQLCPTFRYWRTPLLEDMKRAKKSDRNIAISEETKLCLSGWIRVFRDTKIGFPIANPDQSCPEDAIHFITDAAGLARETNLTHDIGVGACGYSPTTGDIFYVGRDFWDKDFITKTFDESGKFLGCKSTTLEILGWLLPLYHNKTMLSHNEVLMQVDNKAAMYGYNNGRACEDKWASFFINAINFVLVRLQCRMHIMHCKRVSNEYAKLVDALTRTDQKGLDMAARQTLKIQKGWPPSFQEWMKTPVLDPDFKWKLLKDFK